MDPSNQDLLNRFGGPQDQEPQKVPSKGTTNFEGEFEQYILQAEQKAKSKKWSYMKGAGVTAAAAAGNSIWII